MISLEGVSFRYAKAKKNALSSVTLKIPQGSFFALLGPNGAGKTTLLRLLCGRFAAFEGVVVIADGLRAKSSIAGRDALDLKRCGILLENPGVYPKLSVEEYLSYFAGFYGLGGNACMPGGVCRKRLENLTERLELPSLSTKMGELSLGSRQKVQILRAMVHNPKLLILDEPVANLDPKARECVWKLISEWRREEGGTAIVCSHILAEMEQEATDFAIVESGQILRAGGVSSEKENASEDAKNFNLSFDRNVSAKEVLEALNAAGIAGASVKVAKKALSDLYREAVNLVGSRQ